MFRIAICDDQAAFLKRVDTRLSNIEKLLNINFDIDIYTDGEDIVNAVQLLPTNHYKIIIFDILMKNMTGIKAAAYLRNFGWNQSKFIFISGYDAYFRELCALEPSAFIDKSEFDVEFEKTFLNLYHRFVQDETQFTFYNKKAQGSASLSDIVYFESKKHYIFIKVRGTDEKIEFYGALADVKKRLDNCPFIMPQKSFIVNIAYIQKITKSYVLLKDGTKIAVSRLNKNQVLQRYSELTRGLIST